MQLSIFSLAEHRASPFRSPDCARAWLTHAGTSLSLFLESLIATVPNGSFGRTSPVCCRKTEDGRLAPYSEGWQNSGLGSPAELLTLNTCEWTGLDGLSLSDEGVSSLSAILEIGAVPPRYYLSPRACRGILRRAEKRGKELPAALRQALEAATRTMPATAG